MNKDQVTDIANRVDADYLAKGPIRFDGETYEPNRDRDRLARQLGLVRGVMAASGWMTLAALAKATNCPEASVSARLRDLRKPRFGAWIVDRRYVGDGLWEYRLREDPIQVKPPECAGCPPEGRGAGFAPPSGPTQSLICFVGEALGAEEVRFSTPFVGAAGHKLNASIERLGMSRDQVRVGNVISCRPPGNELVGTSWEHGAIAHCRVHRRKLEDHHVYVTLGVTATRTMRKEIHGIEYGGKLENWRGYVIGDGPPYIIPTYHPSNLIQGQQRLTGVFLHDIKRAMEVASFASPGASLPWCRTRPPSGSPRGWSPCPRTTTDSWVPSLIIIVQYLRQK